MIDEKLKSMGITLQTPPAPAGSYVPVMVSENMAFVSGQIPLLDGKVAYRGAVNDGNIEDAQQSARLCAINVLAQLRGSLRSLDRVARIIKVSGFVCSDPGFAKQHLVINGASELFTGVFGDAGRHARIAVGVPGLPLGAMTEVDALVELHRD